MEGIPPRTQGKAEVRASVAGVPVAVSQTVLSYIHSEQAGGIMLVIGSVLGLVLANSPWVDQYQAMLHVPIQIAFVRLDALHWINEGLMTLFFLLIGLEIKREMSHGELSTFRGASLPVAAAIGGMLVPAAVYYWLNLRAGGVPRAWGIPVATDIAFALGVLALLGNRVPARLKVFLLAFATADDIGGVIVIATIYTASINWWALAAAGGIVIVTVVFRKLRAAIPGMYTLLAVALWFALYKSGVHATIAGVIVGLLTPMGQAVKHKHIAKTGRKMLDSFDHSTEDERAVMLGKLSEMVRFSERPVERVERFLRPWVSYVALPLFAAANAGVPLSMGLINQAVQSPVAQGIVAALMVGKFFGVVLIVALGVMMRILFLPPGMGMRHVVGAALLSGIGFTVSLFIADLALPEGPARDSARIAILAASVAMGAIGFFYLWLCPPVKASEMNGYSFTAVANGQPGSQNAAVEGVRFPL